MTYHPEDRPIQSLNFEEIQVGDVMELKHQITQADVDAFAALTGDYNPLHMDKEFARKTTFQKPIAHGMLSASFISTMIGMLLPGRGSLWTSQTLEFLNPVFINDTITVTANVKQKSLATRILVLQITITNQNGIKLVNGESTLKHLELKNERETMPDDSKMNILISGGGGGIGKAAAKKLAKEGHSLVITDLHLESAEIVASEINNDGGQALAIQADISNSSDVDRLFSEIRANFGEVQAFVHCASMPNHLHAIDELNWEDIQRHLDVQVKGAFYCSKKALEGMLPAQKGAMVFISSIAAEGVPPVHQADYVIAKTALSAFAHSLAAEYGPKGIRVNIVAPGMTQTEMISHIPEKARMLTRMQTPLRRLAEPEDIANGIAFLLSNNASHITGETLRINGGLSM